MQQFAFMVYMWHSQGWMHWGGLITLSKWILSSLKLLFSSVLQRAEAKNLQVVYPVKIQHLLSIYLKESQERDIKANFAPKWFSLWATRRTKKKFKQKERNIKWGTTLISTLCKWNDPSACRWSTPLASDARMCVFCCELCALCSRSCMAANHCSTMETWENNAVFLKSHRRYRATFLRSFLFLQLPTLHLVDIWS